jgi:hypothetical protein
MQLLQSPRLWFIVILSLAPGIFMLTFRVQLLQWSSLYVTKSTAKQGSSCSLASKRTQQAMGNEDAFIEVAVDLRKQMLLMQLVVHTPSIVSRLIRRKRI